MGFKKKYAVEFTIVDLIPLPEDVPGGDRQTINNIISYCSANNIESEIVNVYGHHGYDTDHHDDEQHDVKKSETFVCIHFETEEIPENDPDGKDKLYAAALKSLQLPEANIRHSYGQRNEPHERHVIEVCSYYRD